MLLNDTLYSDNVNTKIYSISNHEIEIDSVESSSRPERSQSQKEFMSSTWQSENSGSVSAVEVQSSEAKESPGQAGSESEREKSNQRAQRTKSAKNLTP